MTGCDSSKDNDTKNPQFVKHGKDDAFTFNDGTKVVFYNIKSRAKSVEGKSPYHAITFTFTVPDNATATLSPLNFAAYVTAPMTCIGINTTARTPSESNPDSTITSSTTINATTPQTYSRQVQLCGRNAHIQDHIQRSVHQVQSKCRQRQS